MPVLTCPFQTIPSSGFTPLSVQYPNAVELSTELTIKPVAGESWDVEGLSIQFKANYAVLYSVNLNNAKKQLEEVLTAIGKQETALAKKLVLVENQVKYLQGQATALGVEGAKRAEVEAVNASIEGAEGEVEGLAEDQQGYVRDKKATERELAELGKQSLFEAAKLAPLGITARLYARGNELIWTSVLAPRQFFVAVGFEWFTATTRALNGEWYESLNTHVQFDDPIDFTERENLRLVFEFAAPPAVKEIEGGFTGLSLGLGMVTPIQAIVNYSRKTEAGQ